MHAAKSRQSHCDDAVAIGGPAQIRDERQDPPPWLDGGRLRLDYGDIGIDVADREDVISLPGQAKRHRAAEPAQAAGDDCDALFHEIPRYLKARNSIERFDRIRSVPMSTGTIFAFNSLLRRALRKEVMMYRVIAPGIVAAALVLGLAGCTNPYDPGQRAVGGGLLGAGAGAAIGGAVGGGHGAALGAAIGGATGAVTGAATTPPPPPPPGAYGQGYGYPPPPAPGGYGYPPAPPPAYPSY